MEMGTSSRKCTPEHATGSSGGGLRKTRGWKFNFGTELIRDVHATRIFGGVWVFVLRKETKVCA